MDLTKFYTLEDNNIRFSREQASLFAKSVGRDFNPIHNADAKKFCVPGDLLFAVVLEQYGVTETMRFKFESMVNENTRVTLPAEAASNFTLTDQNEKPLMSVQSEGKRTMDKVFVANLIEKYVEFSGTTFPDILIRLMKQEGAMMNPTRPLIIYRDMAVNIDQFPKGDLSLELAASSMVVEGKKGSVLLQFNVLVDGHKIGTGTKNMLVSGLRDYDQVAIDQLVAQYYQTKKAYAG